MPSKTVEQQTRLFVFGSPEHIIQGFLIERQSRGLVPGSLVNYRGDLTRFNAWLLANGCTIFEDITPELIRRYLLHIGETRNTGGVFDVFRSIRALCNWYGEEFEPANWRNPIRKVRVKTPSKVPLPGISLPDFQKLIDACQGNFAQRDKTMLLFLLDTGARAAEFTALNVGDIDIMTGSVRICHGKGDKARTVFIGQSVLKQLRRYLRTRTIYPNDPLWLTDEGERFKFGGLRALVVRLARRANIHPPGLHDFRRAFAIQMLRGGVDVMTLARLMGHTTLEVTRGYLHLVTDDLQKGHALGSPVDNLTREGSAPTRGGGCA